MVLAVQLGLVFLVVLETLADRLVLGHLEYPEGPLVLVFLEYLEYLLAPVFPEDQLVLLPLVFLGYLEDQIYLLYLEDL